MKKLIALALALVMALGMVTIAVAEEPIKVGVCIYKFDDNFMTLYRTELEKYLTEKGCQVTVVDGKNDQAEQTNQVNAFIADGVDVLIVNLVQSTAAATVIDLAQAADIPVVFINREPTAEEMAPYDKLVYWLSGIRCATLAPTRVRAAPSRARSLPRPPTRAISTAMARLTTL